MLRLVARLRPREGWGFFLLAVSTVLCLPFAFVTAEWVPRDEGVIWLTLVGLLLGRWFALREDWGWEVWGPVGASTGILVGLSVAGHRVLYLPTGGRAAFGFAERWVDWLGAAVSGGVSDDPDVFLFYAALLCWAGVLIAAWVLYNRRRALLALVPIALLTSLTVFYSGEGIGWLVAQLGCGVLLLASTHLARERLSWETRDVDYAVDLHVNSVAAATAVATLVVSLGYLVPMLSVREISEWMRSAFEDPSSQIEKTAERLFGGVSPPRRGLPEGTEGGGSYLPQNRLLGGRPETLSDVVMMVWTDEPPPSPESVIYFEEEAYRPPHYWRGVAYDNYSGRGWSVSSDVRETLAGDLPVRPPPDYSEVTQYYEYTAPHGDTLYAISAPARVEGEVDVVWHTPPDQTGGEAILGPEEGGADLAGLNSEAMTLTMISYVPSPTAADLRGVPPMDATDSMTRYLQMPDTVPQRVIDLAWEVVAHGATVYERARLLESYLRLYPYSLDVERAPADRDVVDYFLFEIREGYCDYYASAFVVMARAVGIPSRLASGYIGGDYDFYTEAYLIRQRNGHSWPEVYFPKWGWIGFEPTGAQPVTTYPEDVRFLAGALPEPSGPPARVVRARRQRVGLALVAVTGFAALGMWLINRRRLRQAQPLTLPLAWSRVGQVGARLGVPPQSALTPSEYASALTARLQQYADGMRQYADHWQDLARVGGEALETLSSSYSKLTYAGDLCAPPDKQEVEQALSGLLKAARWLGWVGHLWRVSRRSPA